MRSLTVSITLAVLATVTGCGELPGEFPDQEEICSFDAAREVERAASAASFETPIISEMLVNGTLVWQPGSSNQVAPGLAPGDIVTLRGDHLGKGTDTDFSKIMIGKTRILETDLTMYQQKLAISDQVNYETPDIQDTWPKNIKSWNENEVQFKVPEHASSGPLILQVQKRTGYLESLIRPGESHNVINALTSRIIDDEFQHDCDVVSTLSDPKSAVPIAVIVNNPEFDNWLAEGRQVFWSYDYNIGTAHSVRNLDWTKIFDYKSKDPVTGEIADPTKLFGAHPTVAGQVPSEAIDDVYFDRYPMPNPIPGFLNTQPQFFKGNTRDSGWAGYRYAESNQPYKGKGERIGFNCASCHGYKIAYEAAPGQMETKVFPGMTNPLWSMKWTLLDKFEGIVASEEGPSWDSGKKYINKTALLYSMPQGAGEHNLVRGNGEGSLTDNDYQFSPIVIPNVTNYMMIRRSLSHTESYVGFEGSYIHSEEPDGAMGAMYRQPLQALTSYMTELDENDDLLRNLGMYRWLKWKGRLNGQIGLDPGEGLFVQNDLTSYPAIVQAVDRGKQSFDAACASCHKDAFGGYSTEKMVRLDKVGRFFAPTIYQKETQSIRATFLRNLYWNSHRGLLSDGHVKNLEDLVDPARCEEGSDLYNQYYTLHQPDYPALGSADHPEPYPAHNRKGDVFRVPKSPDTIAGRKSNRFIERHKYFSSVDWDPNFYYWDYQKMRAEYGPDEMKTAGPIGMPAAPHPWCAGSADEVDDMVQYLLTL
ncbi:hypothetical protein [Pelagibaculum spongiae]|uniref:Cytochrome c domain-containing protein n=1 Tax=Pelagibaculum spongiae TaxID=2080658 RepID=A0A2V1GZQ2_9GAMM|nr:hypothetical protein [Pelagibaculum spongiae]PVZ67619.1 hypothetical protein DC094_14360 [Pelagibaculum spongiae]